MSLLVPCLAVLAMPTLEIGFCDSNGNGLFKTQPADQMERWALPVDNTSHLVIDWRPDRRVSGRNVSSYHVDVKTSVPVLNWFVGAYGGFPQDLCAAEGSKARSAVDVCVSPGSVQCVPFLPCGSRNER